MGGISTGRLRYATMLILSGKGEDRIPEDILLSISLH
jgi:hypothetical protein